MFASPLVLVHTLVFAHALFIYSASAKSKVSPLVKAPLMPLGKSKSDLFHDPEFIPEALFYCSVFVYFSSSYNRQNLYLQILSFLLSDFPSNQYIKVTQ